MSRKRTHSRSRSRSSSRSRSFSRSGSRDGSKKDKRSKRKSRSSSSPDRSRERRDKDRGKDRSRRDKRERRRTRSNSRSRSRSNSRDRRDRRRDQKSKSKSNDRDKDDDLDDDKPRRRDKKGLSEPSCSVMVRGLPITVSEQILTDAVAAYNPSSIRLIRDRTTGQSRGFGFLEFATIEESQKFVYENYQTLKLHDRLINIDFSHGQNRASASSSLSKNRRQDWMCGGCDYINFARRDKCFQCSKARGPDSTILSMDSESSGQDPNSITTPNPVLVVRGLDVNTSEDSIRYTFSPMVEHGVKEIRMARDKTTNKSRGFCFVEFESTEDATTALGLSVGLQIEGQFVQVSFSRDHQHLGDGADLTPTTHNTENHSSGDRRRKKKPLHQRPPNISPSFSFDEPSGCWYDGASGFYFDPTSQLYYHGQTGIYYRWDPNTQNYIQVDSRGVAKAETPTPDQPAQQTPTPPQTTPMVVRPPTAVVSIAPVSVAVVPNPAIVSAPPRPTPIDKAAVAKSFGLALKKNLVKKKKKMSDKKIAVQGGQSKEIDRWNKVKEAPAEPSAPLPEPDKWLDYEQRQCLLCKRQFKAIDQLLKHKDLSDLHKKNIEIEEYKQVHQEAKKSAEVKVAQHKQEVEANQRRKRMFEDMVAMAAKKEGKEKPIDDSNVGNRMLKAMGWKEGSGLGKKGTGIVAPIKTESHSERAGLGSEVPGETAATYQESAKIKTRARYERFTQEEKREEQEKMVIPPPTPANDYLKAMQEYMQQSCTEDDFVRPLLK